MTQHPENNTSADPVPPPPYSELQKIQSNLSSHPPQQQRGGTATLAHSISVAGNFAFETTERVISAGEMASKGLDVVKKVLGDTDNPVLSHMIQLADRLVDVGRSVPFIAPAFVILKARGFERQQSVL
jgi:hypothetical protein